MSAHEWAVFGEFAVLLLGLSLISPEMAVTVGIGVGVIMFIKNPTFFLPGG